MRRLNIILFAMAVTLGGAGTLHALRPPHDMTSNNITCGSCHKAGTKFRGYKPVCTTECHNTGSTNNSKRKPLDMNFASDRFGTFTNVLSKKQFSHAWATLPNYSAAGMNNKPAGANKLISENQPSVKIVSGTNTIVCSKCHYAHGAPDTALTAPYYGQSKTNKPFLRVSTKGDYICIQCHEVRNIDSVRSNMQSAVISGSKHYSHPVQVSYSGAKYRKSQEMDSEGANLKWEDWFEASPTNEPGWNESARPRLYTSYDGSKKDAVVCSTCHGPMHSADSNPYTLDNITSFSKGIYTTSAGNLLRRYPMSDATWGDKTCTACHKVKTHQGYQCNRCHEPHKRKGDNNIYLIRTSIQTPYAKQSVYFTSTSQMAKRWGIYSSPNSSRSTAICQVCHRTKSHHRAYSTAGGDREHKYLGNNKFQNCILCHPHNAAAGGFAQTGGCNTCHDAPPSDNGNTWGKHAKHVGSAGYKWMPSPPTVENTLNDTRSASDYGFSCGRCHNAWTPYTASANGKSHYGEVPGSLKNFTADIGFGKGTHPLPTNSTDAGYNYGATDGIDSGPNSGDVYTWRYPGTAGTDGQCRNLYCHGQFYNGYTSNNPTWRGTQTCGACHGAKRSNPPGKTNGVNWGAHPRHVGNADNQQYGFSGWKFGCNACHYPTTMSSMTSIDDRSTHVDGRVNIEFNGGGYGDANSTYNGFVDYTGRKPSMSKPAYRTCGRIYCHSDGSRMSNYSAPFNAGVGTGSGRFPNWSSAGKAHWVNSRCSKCHGNSSHAGQTSAMPGVTSKGNSHEKHVYENGFACSICHSRTVKGYATLSSVNMHVNKVYDVNVISKYVGGTFQYNADKTCSNVECHGNRLTPAWGGTAVCKDCHFKSTSEVTADEGYNDSYTWRNMTTTSSIPKIYSTEWVTSGHGRSSGNYPSSGNAGAGKVCTNCHKASGSKSHQSEMTNNPYRVYTAPSHIDDLCQQCHASSKPNAAGGGADKKVLTHYTTGWGDWGNAKWPFMPKCIDCHDPHGDNNRYMVQKFINFTGSDSYGKVANSNYVRQVTFSTVGGGQMNWSSYVNSGVTGICQRCHNTQADMNHFNKATYNAGHNAPNRCTGCHKHDTGFKGLDCGQCHNFPPTLSGKHSFHVATSVNKSYVDYDLRSTKNKYAYGCGKCHNSNNHIGAAQNVYTAELVFDSGNYPKNSGTYVFGAKSSIDQGADGPSGYTWTSTKGQCLNLYCHGEFVGGNTGNDPQWYNTGPSDPQTCGKCHGATQASAPSGGAHGKHVNVMGYDCRNCHDDTVDAGVNTPNLKNKVVHVDGKTQYKLYTALSQRIGGAARYNGTIFGRATTEVGSATYGYCQNIYCHSKGTNMTNPYNVASAYPNYTAKWGSDNFPANPGEKCSYCHGSKKTAGGYAGITSAMPNYPTGSPKINSHKKHVVDNGFSCYACHAATVGTDGRSISTPANHANQVYDVSFPSKYDAGGASYASSKCSNIKCHGGRLTPAWGATAINCTDCHYRSSAGSDQDVMDYTFRNYTDTASVPKIYSTEWKASGHGKSAGNYNRTNNAPAGKICNTCHVSSVKHNTGSNFFRLTGLGGQTDPSTLCKRCHGTVNERQVAWMGNRTGIQGHTQQILSSAGYQNLTTWRFTPKCTDCHDPHGDSNSATAGNIAMIRNTVLYNFSGSDNSGKPVRFPNLTTVFFEKYTGTRSFDDASGAAKGRLCAACHKRTAHNGTDGSGHANDKKDCRTCHTHKKGFTPAGCTGCHGDGAITIDRANWAPPKGPTDWSDSLTNMSSVHRPHAYNPRSRPGFGNQTGFACQYCHDDAVPASVGHNTPKDYANMNNLTSTTGWAGRNKQSKLNFGTGVKRPADDTCWNTTCHTPRAYTRTWKKPTNCDDCHGYTRLKGSLNGKNYRAFNLQTTQSHKIHINWTGIATPPASWKKNYKFACSNCHYDPANNYSTHYSGQVNITSSGPVNTVGAAFYTRGRAFKGFTSGNESLGTCSKTYCHGNFTNGTTTLSPNWKKGVTTLNCGSCHKAKTAKVSGWGTGTLMPAPHPTHVNTATYDFTCARCHNWTVTNNTTVQFTYSTHVNTRKDVNFDNTSGGFDNSTKMCQNNYCHSSGQTVTPRTVSNYTAEWDKTVLQKTGAGRLCAYCHGNKTFGGITAAMPNYANQAHAKHARNATGENFRCYVCHAGTVNAAGTILNNGNHVNKFKNISIIATFKSGQTMYSTTVDSKKTCKNVKCHGGRTTPKWTLTTGINCMDCHKSTTGDTDKRVSAYRPFQGFSGLVNSVPKIYSTQWAERGHGRSSGAFPVSGNTISGSKVCTDCHGSGETRAGGLSTKHGNTANNPFRLFTAPSSPNTVCNRCHGVGGAGATKKDILTHASSVTGQGHNYEIKCIDCHDPHGDNNAYMVHSTVVRPPDATAARDVASDSFGRRYSNITGLKNVDFTAKNYSSDYAKKIQAPLICQVCHNETQKPRSSTRTRFRWNDSQDMSHGTDKCTGCHSHSSGFKGIDCDGCHGMPPVGASTLIGGASNPGEPASGSNTAGAHQKHVTIWGNSGGTCSKCHYTGMWNSGAKDDDINMEFRAFTQYSGGGQDFNSGTGAKNGFYGVSGVGVAAGTDNRCASMKCHGGGWLTSSLNNISTPLWSDTAKVKCGNCHGAKKVAGSGSWPTTKAHAKHVGTGTGQLDYMCRLCHFNTVQSNNTGLNYPTHVNAEANVAFGTGDARTDGSSAYSDPNGSVNKVTVGKCTNTYCHSRGTDSDLTAPYTNTADYANWTATWSDSRGSYKKTSATTIAKCNYCHGNKSWTGVTSAMPNYDNLSPKANAHPRHVRNYGFLCNSCHDSVVANNTSIKSGAPHVDRAYNVVYNTNTRSIDNNNGGSYTYASGGGRCGNTYCHSKGTDRAEPVDQTADFAVYTAKWGDNRGSYFSASAGMAKCNYCHGSKGTQRGMTSAMPNYANSGSKANRHQKHVVTYGFTCTRCHVNVTVNNTSIDASGGANLHVNKKYNVNFNNNGVIDNIQATYTLQTVSPFSKCKNTYCHSRGTDFNSPFNTRTSFANFTARWGDSLNSYKQTAGIKAKCNYCHGNRLYAGMTSAMPNYSTQIKPNSHKRHVVGYGFTCKACHKYVTNNNSSIDAAGGISRHADKSYNVDFSNSFNNNTGSFTFIGVGSNNKCKNTYCHSRGTDFTKPYSTRTSFANFTARWGENLGTYKKTAGLKAKCNYCHGNRAYSGTTSAMPNYSGDFGAVKAKANSHRVHVIGNGYTCKECHYGVVQNNTSISDRVRHANAFYNISFAPGRRGQAGKMYSSVWSANGVQGTGGGTCMRTSCHGTSTPKWGSPSTASCKACHLSSSQTDLDSYGKPNDDVTARIYSSEWGQKGHGQFGIGCEGCHKSTVVHNYAQSPLSNPFRLMTSRPDPLCLGCHGNATEKLATWNNPVTTKVNYKTHSKANAQAGIAASWNNYTGQSVKCIDCHDPHGDKNKKMIHLLINYTGSDRYGRPVVTPTTQMTFTTPVGISNWSSFANTDVNKSICRRCHTPDTGMGDASGGDMTKTNYAGGTNHQAAHQACTGCHSHNDGFKGAGACNSCHAYPPSVGDGKAYRDAPVNEGKGAHPSHIAHLQTVKNVTLSPTTDQFGTGTAGKICGTCHTNNSSNHQTGVRVINFGDFTTENQFAGAAPFYNGSTFKSGTSLTANRPKNCSNVRCHFQNSPRWQNITAIGD